MNPLIAVRVSFSKCTWLYRAHASSYMKQKKQWLYQKYPVPDNAISRTNKILKTLMYEVRVHNNNKFSFHHTPNTPLILYRSQLLMLFRETVFVSLARLPLVAGVFPFSWKSRPVVKVFRTHIQCDLGLLSRRHSGRRVKLATRSI